MSTRRKFIKQSTTVVAGFALPLSLSAFTKFNPMATNHTFDVIIIGGSYAGLSAAMALGRALRPTLVIDSGKPCNRTTPHSHNFLTQDGNTPAQISSIAKEQVQQYQHISFYEGLATTAEKTPTGFSVATAQGERFAARKLIFATGVKDLLPTIKGFADCWGKSVIHCPYCHGYEVKHKPTGILANGDVAFHYAQLIRNWTDKLTIFTNGPCTLSKVQRAKIEQHSIAVVENEIAALQRSNGSLNAIAFTNGTSQELSAVYARPPFEQHCGIPKSLGCEITEQGLLKVNMMQKTTVEDVFACGDNASPLRAVSYAVASGTIAGAALNNELTEAAF